MFHSKFSRAYFPSKFDYFQNHRGAIGFAFPMSSTVPPQSLPCPEGLKYRNCLSGVAPKKHHAGINSTASSPRFPRHRRRKSSRGPQPASMVAVLTSDVLLPFVLPPAPPPRRPRPSRAAGDGPRPSRRRCWAAFSTPWTHRLRCPCRQRA